MDCRSASAFNEFV